MFKVGSLVKSLKGHDKNRVYVVTDCKGEFAFVVDGNYKTLDKPKKKRVKHLQDLHTKYNNLEKMLDFEIKTFIKEQNNLHK